MSSNNHPEPPRRACTLSLVVPCYNEEATLAECIERIMGIQSDRVQLEIIIVDDGSTDGSVGIARTLQHRHAEVRLVEHEVNRGKGAAFKSGFGHASGDFVGIQDADLEYDPQEYLKLLAPLLDDRADVVFGSRFLRHDERKVLYFWHSWMNKSLTFVSNMMTNLDISDMETCYKLFKREIIQSIDLKENRFGFEPEVVAKVAEKNCRVWEVAISYEPRRFEEGKKITWRDGMQALYCILHYSAHSAHLPVQLLLYLVIGGISAVANLLLFSVLFAWDFGVSVSAVTAYVGAAAVNYLLCIAILFRHRARWSTLGELAMYVLTVSVMGALDLTITSGLYAWGMSPHWSKAVATIFGFIGNFLLRKYLVFPERPAHADLQ